MLHDRYPDEEAGQVPMAFVVKRVRSDINESQIKTFIAEQVLKFLYFVYSRILTGVAHLRVNGTYLNFMHEPRLTSKGYGKILVVGVAL